MIAYCGPGRSAYTALLLALNDTLDGITAIEETPHLDSGTIIIIPDPVTFAADTIPLRPGPLGRHPIAPITTRPADLFLLGGLA